MSGYEKIVATSNLLDLNLMLLSIMDFEGRSDMLMLLANDTAILNRNWYRTNYLAQGDFNYSTTNLFMLDLCYNFLGDEEYDE